jgi:hypothetical protein
MLFEQYQLQTPTINNNNDGGVGCVTANPLFSSLDFDLLDDIDLYLPSVYSKKNKTKNESLLPSNKNTHPIENEISNSSNEQQHEELFSDLDFCNLADFDEKSRKKFLLLFPGFPHRIRSFLELIENNSTNIDDWELGKWISQSSFPSPPMDISQSACDIPNLNTTEDSTSSSSTIPWISEECTIQSVSVDMIVPPSPPLSSVSSSPAPSARKSSKKIGLSTVERKLRKKDQNKTAAEKYRIKKKSEKYNVLDRHIKLKGINRDLKLEADNLSFRIEQLKQLLVDLLQVQLPSTMESN